LNQFASGRFAMMVTGEWALIGLARTYTQQIKYLESKGVAPESLQNPLERPLRLGCVLIPKFPDRPPSYRVRSRSAAINARSPRREEALIFLKYLSGPSYSSLVNEMVDSLPGNPKYAEVGLAPGIAGLSRMEMHEATKQAMGYGYVPRRSPYLLTSDVMEVLKKQISRLESDPGLSVESLLQTAQLEVEKMVSRNLERNPELKKRYVLRGGSGTSLANLKENP
jgi:ABC-type glycerol-3-phosphate transport system substrate-binding protein